MEEFQPNDLYDDIITSIPEGKVFVGYFTRRTKAKSGTEKFYLFSKNSEKLILSAISPSSRNYIITSNSNDVSLTSQSFVGQVIPNPSSLSYQAQDKFGKQILKVDYKAVTNRDRIFRQLNVNLSDSKIITQRLPKLENGLWTLHFPLHNGILSDKNMILDFEGDFCFMFEKIQQDEFYFSVKYPFSIFQGFCIGLSTMKKYLSE